MPDYQCYAVTVTLLTPVHIGTGRDLLHEYDYAIRNGRTWRINENTLLNEKYSDDPDIAERLARTPPAQLLRSEDFKPDSELFRYVIRGTPRSKAQGAQVREQIKDAYDRPYLPGSSLKGALRTALAWCAWEDRHLRPERRKLGRNPKFAAQTYEHELFGRNPNHDLLRALHVGDSAAAAVENLMLVHARVIHRNGHLAAPVEMEALRPDTKVKLTLKVDSALFSEWAGRNRLHGGAWLRTLPERVQRHTAARLKEEADWFSAASNGQAIAQFYNELQRMRLPSSMCLLQLGWGTGWDDKTFGSHLRADANFLEGMLGSRRQGGYGIARGKRRSGDPFPKSRRALVKVRRSRDGRVTERPVSAIGWVLLEMKKTEVKL